MYKMNFTQRGSNFFQRAKPVFSSLFQKARDIASQASPILGNIGRILDVGGGIAQKVAANPELRNINSPGLQSGLGFINRAGQTAQRGGQLAHATDKFVREDTYKNGHETNLTNALERAKGLRNQAGNIFI